MGHSCLLYTSVFVLGVLGTLLKVTVVIMVIAVVLDWMLSFPKLRERLAALALLAAVVAGVNAGSFAAAHSGAFRKAQPGDEISKTHWIMMGLAGNGGYNNEDYVLTFSAPDGETRKALIRDEIAARLKEMGPAGLVRHALDKIGYTWGEGTYYLPHKLAMGPTQPHSFWAEIFFEGRAHFSLFLRYANGLMLCMLLYLLAGAQMCIRDRGVYVTRVLLDGVWRPSATGLGTRPTVNGDGVTCETFIPDFSGDIYGDRVPVRFCRFLWPTQKFGTLEELSAMVGRAAQAAREWREK